MGLWSDLVKKVQVRTNPAQPAQASLAARPAPRSAAPAVSAPVPTPARGAPTPVSMARPSVVKPEPGNGGGPPDGRAPTSANAPVIKSERIEVSNPIVKSERVDPASAVSVAANSPASVVHQQQRQQSVGVERASVNSARDRSSADTVSSATDAEGHQEFHATRSPSQSRQQQRTASQKRRVKTKSEQLQGFKKRKRTGACENKPKQIKLRSTDHLRKSCTRHQEVMARYRHNSLCTNCGRTEDDGWIFVDDSEDDGYDSGSAGEESALHESGECGRNCCGNPNSDDDENEFHDRKLCGPACCGTPSQDDADALIVLDAAVAAAKVAPGTVDGAVFTDVYLEQLLLSYKKRHAQFCRHRRYYSDRMLVPYLVWEKVHAEFLERFPEANFDPLLLKTHLRRALFASNPPNYYCTSSQRKHYAQSASASTAPVASASTVPHASVSKVPVVQATASVNVAATRVVKADGAVSRAAPPSLAARPAPTSNAAEEVSARKCSLAKAARTRSVAAHTSLLYRAVPAFCGARSAKAAAPAAPTFAQKRASVNAKSTVRATATQVPAPVSGLPRHTTVTPRASHSVAAAGATPTCAPVTQPPAVLDIEPNPGSSSSVNGVVPTSCTPAQANGPVIKREQTVSASTSMESSASVVVQQQQQQQMDVESGSLRDDSDHSITEESNSDESIAEDSSPHQQQGSQRDRRQKRRLRASQMELLELKKQKVALENLKLAVELGIITQEECIEKARQVVQE